MIHHLRSVNQLYLAVFNAALLFLRIIKGRNNDLNIQHFFPCCAVSRHLFIVLPLVSLFFLSSSRCTYSEKMYVSFAKRLWETKHLERVSTGKSKRRSKQPHFCFIYLYIFFVFAASVEATAGAVGSL